ncbi:MAG: DNA translocase FtsK [Clostridia bacterium]|nr:DNA translocase FtsK [Clostridia bacterium]
MNTQDRFLIERDARLKYQFLRFKMGIYNIFHKKWVWPIVAIYIAIAIYAKQVIYTTTPDPADIAMVANLISLKITYPFFAVLGFIVLLVFLGTPWGAKKINKGLNIVGLINHAGQSPFLTKRYKDHGLTVLEFEPNGIPLSQWEDKKECIETVLNMYILEIYYGGSRNKMVLRTVSGNENLPSVAYWKDVYLSKEDFILFFGQSMTGQVKINLAKTPHILIGGSTGSGKSVLLKLLVMQCVKKGAVVFIADFKGGVDFLPEWHKKACVITEENALIEMLTSIVNELENRKQILREYGCSNIGGYNMLFPDRMNRIIFACDEVAEILDKTGLSKEKKDIVSNIENKLSIIARQGRAFGIHLILATQRPDANILTGQIRSNIDFRVCGRADNILSQIILDSTVAADKIPKDSQGLFVTQDETVFQSYMFDESDVFKK